MQSFVLFILPFACLVSGSRTAHWEGSARQPKVRLNGSELSGIIDHDYPSVRQFLGIQYAQPPVGELRWEAPQPIRLPRSVNATAYGTSCTQFLGSTPTLFTQDVPEYNVGNVNTSGEDCLSLSLWTPERATNLPVIVFLYGGGWYTGGQDIPYQIPTQWIQRTKDLIVVVPNYRGNIFGFPNARGVKDQNLGLLDQRLAIEWIRDNIKAFGGDPDKVTIWGQSSGAESVDIYNYAWYKDPIVKGLIMDSGTSFIEDIFNSGVPGPRYSNFTYVASQFGCNNTSGPREEIACMKTVDAANIERIVADDVNAGSPANLAFGPAADEKTVFANWTERVLQGKITKLPAIIGLNKEDGNVFTTYNSSGPDQATSDYWFLNLFLCPSFRTAKLRAAAGISTYRYVYAGNFTNVSPRPWMGAYHTSEVPLLFGTHGNYRSPSTKYEVAVSKSMQDAWRAFANNPHEGLTNQDWPRFTAQKDVVRWFGEDGKVAQNRIGDLKQYEDRC